MAAVTAMDTIDFATEPAVYMLGPEQFEGTAAVSEGPRLFSLDGFESGRGPDAGDVDGDGVSDLLIGSRDPSGGDGHASGDLFLGPIEGDQDALDADLVIDQTAHMVRPKWQRAGGWSQVIMTDPDQDGSGVARVAVALPYDNCDDGDWCGKVYIFDWTGPGWLEPEDADLVLVGPPMSMAGNPTMRWGGDVDGDGVPELIVQAAGSLWPTTLPGEGAVFLLEPPLSGTFMLEDSDVIVRHADSGTEDHACPLKPMSSGAG